MYKKSHALAAAILACSAILSTSGCTTAPPAPLTSEASSFFNEQRFGEIQSVTPVKNADGSASANVEIAIRLDYNAETVKVVQLASQSNYMKTGERASIVRYNHALSVCLVQAPVIEGK